MERQVKSFVGGADTKIVYDVWEPEEDPRGLLVISHGLGEHAGRYEHVVQRLGTLGLRIAVPDHRGHGRSGGPRAVIRRFADFSDDLDTLIDLVAVPGAPTYLLGHSMGGSIALDYALEHQTRLAGLILSGAVVLPGSDQPKPLVAVAKVVGRLAPKLPTVKLDSSSVSRDPAVVAAYDADPMVFHGKVPAGLAGELFGAMGTFPKRLPHLRIPILVLHGELDRLSNPAGSTLVVDRAGSPDSTLTIYDGLFHEIFNEPERDAVLDDVAGWLASHLQEHH